MRFHVDVEELCRVDVRVALSSTQTGVAKQLLNRAQVGAALQQMRCEGVPERVRADAGPHAALRRVPPHQPIDVYKKAHPKA